MSDLLQDLHRTIETCQHALNEVVEERIVQANLADMVESTPADISARYWLMQFLSPLSKNELKSIVDGFLVQMMNDDQCRKLVKFLLVRYPDYYKEEIERASEEPAEDPLEVQDTLRPGRPKPAEPPTPATPAPPVTPAEPDDGEIVL